MAGAFALLAAFVWWKGDTAWWPLYSVLFWSISAVFFLAGALLPIVLSPLEWVWMKLALVLNYVMTRVLLSLVYILGITPMGLIFKGLRKDLLDRRFDPNAPSYWIPPEEDGPWTRPDKPY